MRINAHGHHAFGLRLTSQVIANRPQLIDRWLQSIGVTSNRPS
jgi:hypothetical protein